MLRERQELSELMSSLPRDDSAQDVETGEAPVASGKAKALYKRIRTMLHKIDQQLEDFDKDVGGRMHLIQTSSTGKISADDLEQALRLIKHRPSEDQLQKLVDSTYCARLTQNSTSTWTGWCRWTTFWRLRGTRGWNTTKPKSSATSRKRDSASSARRNCARATLSGISSVYTGYVRLRPVILSFCACLAFFLPATDESGT
mgnify:FL=1